MDSDDDRGDDGSPGAPPGPRRPSRAVAVWETDRDRTDVEDETVVIPQDSLAHGQTSDGSDGRELRRLVVLVHWYTSFGSLDSPAAGCGDRVSGALVATALEQAAPAELVEECLHVVPRPLFGDAERVDQGLDQLRHRALLGELSHQHRSAGVGRQVRGRAQVEDHQVAVDLAPGDVVQT